jgi:type II secretory pathway pseudopilin PulG
MTFFKHTGQDGDTLVEVLLAISILSIVVIGSMRVMNAGQNLALSGIEHTTVQAALNSQLSIMRYLRDEYIRANNKPITPAANDWQTVASSSYFVSDDINSSPCNGRRNAFWISDNLGSASPDSQIEINSYHGGAASDIPSPGDGVWLEVQQTDNYIDIVAKACWTSVGSGPNQEAKSTERLFLP